MHRDAAVTTQGDGDRKHLSSIDALPYDFLSPSCHFVVDTSYVLAKSRAPGVSAAITLKKGFNSDGAVVSYLNGKRDSHETSGNSLASAFALSSAGALAHTVRHESHVRTYPMYGDASPSVVLHPNYGNPNGNPDGPSTLSGTGNSQFGGSSADTSGYN